MSGRRALRAIARLLVAAGLVACGSGAATPSSPVLPGTVERPREVNLIAKDWSFVPPVIDLVPGETILLHVVNGGLEPHEAVIGDGQVQAAWERAEAAVAGAPPGPTPVVIVRPEQAGIQLFVASGQRVDLRWTVPVDVTASPTASADGWLIGCHIPGHYEKGMVIPIRFVVPEGGPSPSPR